MMRRPAHITPKDAKVHLIRFEIRSIEKVGSDWVICVGNCGKRHDTDRKFRGNNLAAVVQKVINTLKDK